MIFDSVYVSNNNLLRFFFVGLLPFSCQRALIWLHNILGLWTFSAYILFFSLSRSPLALTGVIQTVYDFLCEIRSNRKARKCEKRLKIEIRTIIRCAILLHGYRWAMASQLPKIEGSQFTAIFDYLRIFIILAWFSLGVHSCEWMLTTNHEPVKQAKHHQSDCSGFCYDFCCKNTIHSAANNIPNIYLISFSICLASLAMDRVITLRLHTPVISETLFLTSNSFGTSIATNVTKFWESIDESIVRVLLRFIHKLIEPFSLKWFPKYK